jgi:uncharacterized protein (TIGR03083 family)
VEVIVTASIWPTIHAERAALAEDLTGLDAERWTTPSLCGGWTVHQVLAHLVATARMTPPRFLAAFVASGFSFDRFTERQVAVVGADGPAATLAAFRAAERRATAPPGPKDSWLGEILVHGEDIRRPLGISHAYPTPDVVRAIRFYSGSNVLIGGKGRVDGVTLTATDTDFSTGSGPVVSGPALSLLLATTGRSTVLGDLTGPGVALLRERG